MPLLLKFEAEMIILFSFNLFTVELAANSDREW